MSFTTAGLAVGSYPASITISATGVASQVVTVALTVTELPAALSVSTTSLTASVEKGKDAAATSFTLRNSGGGTLSYSVADSATWLSVSPASGTSTGEIDTIGVSFTTAGLGAGSYTASITVSAAGVASRVIAVSLTVLPGTPQLELSTTSLDAAAIPGQSPTGQSFTVRNAGDGTLAYAVTADQSWITVSPASGTSTGEADTLAVSFSTTSLGAGTNSATLTVSAAGLPSKTIAVSVRLAGAGASFDLDGDGYSDALFRHMDGTISGWLLSGRTIRSTVSPPGMDASWTLAGAGDFDGDGRSFDFLWVQPASGSVVVALNDGATQKASGSAGAVTNGSQVAGVADFDGDGKSDVLWVDPAKNTATVWLMDRLNVKSIQVVATLDAGWNVAATGDFDGDRKADILLQRAGSQDLMIWLLDGVTVRQSLATQLNTGWIAVSSGDFNGDGKADLVASAPILGLFSILAGNGTGFVPTELLAGGTPSASVAATGDYDANGKDDLLFYDASSGAVSIWLHDAYSRLTRLRRLNVQSINTLGTLDSSWAVIGEKGTVR